MLALGLAQALVVPAGAQQGRPRRPGPRPSSPAAEHAAPSPWKVTWTAALGGFAQAAPAADQGLVIVPLRTGQVVGMAADTGQVRWTAPAQTEVGLAAAGGAVYVALADALECRDSLSGEPAWRAPVPAPPAAAPLVAGALVVTALRSGAVRGVDRSSGRTVWEQDLGGSPVLVSPVSDDRFLAALPEGEAVLVEASSGRIAWRQRLPAQISAVRAGRDRAFVGARDNFLYALDGRDGRVRWRWRTGGDVIGVPEVDERRVYFVSLDNVVRALDRDNGAQRWKAGLPSRPLGGPLVLGSEIIVASVSAALQVVDAATGKLEPAATLDAEPATPPVAVGPPGGAEGPSLVIVTRDGKARGLTRGHAEDAPSEPAPPPQAPPGRPPVLP